jgi:bacteriocin biosynthesis cyclodehydratase domain-containing protein
MGVYQEGINMTAFLPKRPKIPERFSIIPTAQGDFHLYSLTNSLSLSSAIADLLSRLLPLLNGQHDLSTILDELHTFGEEEIIATLEHFLEMGVLEDASSLESATLSSEEIERYRDQLTFFSHFTLPESSQHSGAKSPWDTIPKKSLEYQEKLKHACVVVVGLGRLGSQLVKALTLAGVGRIIGIDDGYVNATEAQSDAWFDSSHVDRTRCTALAERVTHANPWVKFTPLSYSTHSLSEMDGILQECTFAVLSTDYFNPEEYDAFNLLCLQSKTAWTSCRLTEFEFNIGPTVIPYKTPCYKCFDLRQKSNLTDYEEALILEGYLKANKLQTGMLTITPGVELAALEVIKALTYFMEPATYAHLFSLNLLTLECKRHPILKIPRCSHCGRPSQGYPTIHAWQQLPREM